MQRHGYGERGARECVPTSRSVEILLFVWEWRFRRCVFFGVYCSVITVLFRLSIPIYIYIVLHFYSRSLSNRHASLLSAMVMSLNIHTPLGHCYGNEIGQPLLQLHAVHLIIGMRFAWSERSERGERSTNLTGCL